MKRYLITKPHLLKDIRIVTHCYTHYINQNNETYGIVSKEKEMKKEDLEYKIKMQNDNYKKIKTHKLVKTETTEAKNKIITYGNVIVVEIKNDEKQLETLINKSIEITENGYFTDENLTTINHKKIILEGPDFSGKTTLAKKLINRGVLVQERDLENFSFWIRDFIEEPGQIIRAKIKDKKDIYIVMTLSDEVLKERMKSRNNLTDFDKIAAKNNEIYKNLNLNLDNVKRIHIENNEEDSFKKFEECLGIK